MPVITEKYICIFFTFHNTTPASPAKPVDRGPTHPSQSVFRLLPSRRRLQNVLAKTSRFKDSFSPPHRAVTVLKSFPSLPPLLLPPLAPPPPPTPGLRPYTCIHTHLRTTQSTLPSQQCVCVYIIDTIYKAQTTILYIKW